MICFICNLYTSTLSSLITHYKIMHLFRPHSSYMCKENNCSQSFQTLSSFKKHVLKKHTVENHLNEIEFQNEFPNNNVVYNCDIEITNTDNTFGVLEIPETTNNIFDINKSIEQLHLLVVQFSLSLHNNNNFCRSYIINIQNDIEKKL